MKMARIASPEWTFLPQSEISVAFLAFNRRIIYVEINTVYVLYAIYSSYIEVILTLCIIEKKSFVVD